MLHSRSSLVIHFILKKIDVESRNMLRDEPFGKAEIEIQM